MAVKEIKASMAVNGRDGADEILYSKDINNEAEWTADATTWTREQAAVDPGSISFCACLFLVKCNKSRN